MCGEKSSSVTCVGLFMGSPPRVRGEVTAWSQRSVYRGITPACAGRSNQEAATSTIAKDHPRVCGEKGGRCYNRLDTKGSPPRVRGEAFQERQKGRNGRITPACAGRRTIRLRIRPQNSDHPRVCGEKSVRSTTRSQWRGSPPRVRGEGTIQQITCGVTRITPACAGRSAGYSHGSF